MDKLSRDQQQACGQAPKMQCKPPAMEAGERHGVRPRAANLTPPFKFAGELGAVGSAFLFSLGIFFVKLMPVEDVIQEKAKMAMIRGLSMMLICGASILVQGSGGGSFAVAREEVAITLARSLLGFVGFFGTFAAVQFITVAELAALAYSSPLWTCILGYLLLRERLPVSLIAALPLGALGILLIAHPRALLPEAWICAAAPQLEPDTEPLEAVARNLSRLAADLAPQIMHNNSELNFQAEGERQQQQPRQLRWIGMLVAVLTSVTFALASICLKLRKRTPILTTTFYLGLTIFLLSTLVQCAIGFGRWPSLWLEWALHAAIGLCTALTQTLLQWSLQYESASLVSVVQTVEIVFSFIWSVVFLGEAVLWTSSLGALLIVLMVLLVMLNEQIQRSLSACFVCNRTAQSELKKATAPGG